jgi:hypothetical protein
MSITSIVIGLAVLVWLLVRQLSKRSVKEDRQPIFLLVLLVIGIVDLGQFVHGHPVSATAVAMLVASLLVAAVFGAIRAYTVRLWREDGTLYQQGSLVTVALWIVAIAAHFGIDFLVDRNSPAQGLATAAVTLYIAVSFGVQRFVVRSRAVRAVV